MNKKLEYILQAYKIDGKVLNIKRGSRIDLYEVLIPIGISINKIIKYSKDIARHMGINELRIVENTQNNSTIGIEIARKKDDWILNNLENHLNEKCKYNNLFPFILGEDIYNGEIIFGDLSNIPHLLISGATGTGKSHFIKSIIGSLVYNLKPEQIQLILMDFKWLELTCFKTIPHLTTEIVTETEKAFSIFNFIINEMDNRFKILQNIEVDLLYKDKEYHTKLPFPRIVVIIDEFSDIILTYPQIEKLVIKIAQKGRAAGIHLIISTQRPSKDVMTGLLKANFLDKVVFKVNSKVDSMVILGETGAEKLLGYGDCIYKKSDGLCLRIHSSLFTSKAFNIIINKVNQYKPLDKVQNIETKYLSDDYLSLEDLEILQKLLDLLLKEEKISISKAQRDLRIGYNRSYKLVDLLEKLEIVKKTIPGAPRILTDKYNKREININLILKKIKHLSN